MGILALSRGTSAIDPLETVNFAQASQVLLERFVAEWAGASAYTLTNEDYRPLKGQAWVEVQLHELADDGETMGPRGRYKRRCMLAVRVSTPRNGGVTASSDLVQRVKNAFRQFRWGNLWCDGIEVAPEPGDPQFYVVVAACTFRYDEAK